MTCRKSRVVLRIQVEGDKGRSSIVSVVASVVTVLFCAGLSPGVPVNLPTSGVYTPLNKTIKQFPLQPALKSPPISLRVKMYTPVQKQISIFGNVGIN